MTIEPDGLEQREAEFLTLFSESQRRLHAYILALVFDPDVAADILQETNIVLWQKFDQFQKGTNFFAWAREIARISILRHRQKSSARITIIDSSALEQLAFDFADRIDKEPGIERDALDDCLQNLRSSDRELIIARYKAGASVSGLAQRLDRTANSLSQSLCRIRRSLSDCVGRKLGSAARGS